MSEIKVKYAKFAVCIFYILIVNSEGLEPLKEEDIIVSTESILKNLTYRLFTELHLKKLSSKLKQSLLVHNFFTSVTLQDHKTLNLVIKFSKVDKNDVKNETDIFINIINSILDEDRSNADVDTSAHNEDVLQYVDEFLTNLEELKEVTGFNSDYDSLEVNDEVVKILKSHNVAGYESQTQSNTSTEIDFEEEETFSEIDFWVPEPERRVYKGQKTKAKYFPFMASIHIFNGFQCAGSIVKADLIVTAASCLQLAWNNRFFRENPAFLSVRVGSNFYTGGGESIPVLEVYFYPDYTPKTLKHNIAILRLIRHLKFRKRKKKVKKINIDRSQSSLPMTTAGITIVGWGAKGVSNIVRDPWNNQMAFAVLDVYSLQECQKIYSRQYVTRTNFCAGFISKGGGACNHDVGGPGVVNGILAGVISFGSPVCGTIDAPTVFTKVGFYADWIEEIMEQDVPRIRKKTTLYYPSPIETTLKYVKSTFTFTPILSGETPIPAHIAGLRILKDEGIFKEFLSTVFEAKDVKHIKELLREVSKDKSKVEEKSSASNETLTPQTNTLRKEKLIVKQPEMKNYQEPVVDRPETYTKIDKYEAGTEKLRYTALDDEMLEGNNAYDDIVEKNILKLIENIDSSNIDDNSTSGSTESSEVILEAFTSMKPTTTTTLKQEESIMLKEGLPEQPVLKAKQDEIMTVLYLSNENSESEGNLAENDFENVDDSVGLSIAQNGFVTDLSTQNNETHAVLDAISQNALYDLLFEAIDEVTSNKTL